MPRWNQIVLGQIQQNPAVALVTLISQSGSAPRTAGARMIISPDDHRIGTIGGGIAEGNAIKLAHQLLNCALSDTSQTKEWRSNNLNPAGTLFFSLHGVQDMDMICGGELRILVEVLYRTADNLSCFAKAAKAEEEQENFLFITHLAPIPCTWKQEQQDFTQTFVTKRTILFPHRLTDNEEPANIPQEIFDQTKKLRTEIPQLLRKNGLYYLLEFFPQQFCLHIFGAGHIAEETAQLAQHLNFSLRILDDRKEFANADRFPSATIQVLPSLEEENIRTYFKKTKPGSQHGIIIVTRGHAFDRDVLAAALDTQAGYIGMIGSTTKRQKIYADLESTGISPQKLAFVHSPIGLDILAETPQEIAVSIAAELILWRHKTELENQK